MSAVEKLKGLWAREPVLVAGLLPLLVSLGAITAQDADMVRTVVEAVAASVTVIVAAVTARARVSPVAAGKHDAKHEKP